MMKDGPFPLHYEPFESPVVNLIARKIRVTRRPACSRATWRCSATPRSSPTPLLTYRLTEHFHYWTKHNRVNASLQPEFFVEISEELAKQKGIVKGSWVRVWSKRGSVKASCRRHQAHQAADMRRQARAYRRCAHPLGLHGSRQEGFRRQRAHAVRRRCEHRNPLSSRCSWSTSSHQRTGGSMREGCNNG